MNCRLSKKVGVGSLRKLNLEKLKARSRGFRSPISGPRVSKPPHPPLSSPFIPLSSPPIPPISFTTTNHSHPYSTYNIFLKPIFFNFVLPALHYPNTPIPHAKFSQFQAHASILLFMWRGRVCVERGLRRGPSMESGVHKHVLRAAS